MNVQNHISKMGLKPGQDGLEHGDWPPLQSLGEDGVVGVGTALHRHIPGLHNARAHGEKNPLTCSGYVDYPGPFTYSSTLVWEKIITFYFDTYICTAVYPNSFYPVTG